MSRTSDLPSPAPTSRFPTLAAAFFGFTGVAIGALGAHRLWPLLMERGMTRSWETASKYHLLHAVALVGLAALYRTMPQASGPLLWAARLWSVGIVLFSFSLYAYTLGGPRFLAHVTPFGGIIFLAGWACVFAAGLKRQSI